MTTVTRTGKAMLTAGLALAISGCVALAIMATPALAARPATAVPTSFALASTRSLAGSVASPPPAIRPGERLKLQIRATRVPVLYLSHGSRRDRTSVRLPARVHLRRGRGTVVVTVPRKLAPGAWFVLACAPHGRCAASKTPGVVPLARPGRPVNTVATLTGTDASAATIGTAGGSLQATGPDGTRYLLAIPPDSLAQDTAITMTPLEGLSGAGFAGKLVGGVQFAPEGLLLFRGATLTITPRHPVPADRLVPFGYTGSGTDLHVVALTPSRSRIELPLAHFSGAGVGDSPAGPAGAPAPSDNTGFYGQMFGQLAADWRDGSMTDAQFQAAAESVIRDWYRDIANDEIPPGMNDDAAATTAIRDLLTWGRTAAQTVGDGHACSAGDAGRFCTYDGMSRDFGPDWEDELVLKPVTRLVQGMYHRAQQRCASNHDLSEIGSHIIPDARELALLGVPEIPFSELYSCLHFQVQIDSVIHHDASFDGQTLDFHYQSTIPVKLDPSWNGSGAPPLNGAAPGTYASASGSGSSSGECAYDGSPYTQAMTMTAAHGNTVTVSAFSFPLSAQDTAPLHLTIDSSAAEDYHFQKDDPSGDPRCTSSLDETVQNWWGQVQVGSIGVGDASFAADSESVVIPLDGGSGAVFAQKTIPAWDGLGDTGHTTITVIHNPPSP